MHFLWFGRVDKSIDQFPYIKIQPNTTDLSTRLWGINPTNSVVILQSLVQRSMVLCWISIYRNWSIFQFGGEQFDFWGRGRGLWMIWKKQPDILQVYLYWPLPKNFTYVHWAEKKCIKGLKNFLCQYQISHPLLRSQMVTPNWKWFINCDPVPKATGTGTLLVNL